MEVREPGGIALMPVLTVEVAGPAPGWNWPEASDAGFAGALIIEEIAELHGVWRQCASVSDGARHIPIECSSIAHGWLGRRSSTSSWSMSIRHRRIEVHLWGDVPTRLGPRVRR